VFIPRSKPTPTQPKSSQGESLFASTQKVTTSWQNDSALSRFSLDSFSKP
jgi:hypothetical protein